MVKDQKSQLNLELKTLNHHLSRQTSPKYRFFLGIVTGIGTALGASIIAAILFFFLSQFIKTVEDIPFLNSFIETSRLQKVLDEESVIIK